MSAELPGMSIGALRALYRSGALVPVELIEAIYDRMEAAAANPVWITRITREEAVACARALPPNLDLPLYGIPFAVKDNIDAAGLRTTAACPAYAYTPEADAFAVARLKQAGAILIGKTNMDQFATGLAGTRSPYGACSSVFDSRYISGGSSSGSAVAVAAGFVSFSLGTDTAGSGRVPAAFNNIVGLKPSRGLIGTSGVVPACRSLDCVSIFALSCMDAATVFDVVKAVEPNDPFSRSGADAWPSGRVRRIGTPKPEQLAFFGNAEYARLYAETIAGLQDAGHSICEIDFAPFRAAAELLYAGPYVAERFAAVGEFVKSHTAEVDPVVAGIVLGAERWTAVDAYQALYRLAALQRETEKAWQNMDVLLLPTAPTTYTIEQVQNDPVQLNATLGYYTNFVNLLDLCAVAVPAGFTRAGLPFGVTAIARAFSEKGLLVLANSIQQARPGDGWILLSVVGAHLSGQPLNYQLVERGARLVRTAKTGADYRLFALTNTTPVKPGLLRTPGFAGPGIETEIWAMPEAAFGSFVAAVPPPLSIGTCALSDGTAVKGFLCEPYATEGMPDITHFGSWRAYLSTV